MMKRYLPIALAAMLVAALAVPATASPFADVPESHWAYEAVKQLAAYGIIEGFPDGTFKGAEPTTRYQMAMVVARLLVSLDAQIKAAIEAAKAQTGPSPVEKVIEKETVTVEKPVIEKVVESTIVEKLKTEDLNALAARLADVEGTLGEVDRKADDINARLIQLDGALALLEGEFGVKSLELETAVAAGDADLADKIAALQAEMEAKLADADSTLNGKIEAKAKELIMLIDALKTEFSRELTVLGVRVAALEDQLAIVNARIDDLEAKLAASHEELASSIAAVRDDLDMKLASVNAELQVKIAAGDTEAATKLAATKAQLEAQIAALDAKAGAIGTKLDEYIAGHEKVAISGSSEVVLEDVDIYAEFGLEDNQAWEDPNDIFEDDTDDNHGDGAYEPTSTFQHELNLTLTARPADGVVVNIDLATVKDLYPAIDVAGFELDELSLEVKTPGTLTRLFAGNITLPEGTFTPFTLTGDQLLDDDDEPIYEGVIGQVAYGKFSGTTLFWRTTSAYPLGESSPYANYVCAGEGKVALTDNLSLSAAYVSQYDDPQSSEIDDDGGFDPDPLKDTVIAVAGSLALGPGWKVSGEFAKDTKYVDGVADETGMAAKLDLTGKMGSLDVAANLTRIEDTFDPNLVNDDPDDGGIEQDLKSVSVDGTLPVGNLTLTGGYEVTGDSDAVADWDERRANIATAGASYKMTWDSMTVTPAVDVTNSAYVITDDTQAYESESTVFELTGGVDAKLGPLTGSYKATSATLRVGAGTADPYYTKSVFDLGLDYAMTPNLKLTGGYTWTRVDEEIVVVKGAEDDDIDDENTAVFKAGLAGEFPLSGATKVTGSYDYEVKNDLLNDYEPYTKGILKTGVTSQLTQKASIAASAEFDRLDRWTSATTEYEYAPLSNLIASVDYTYNITTNTTLALGYKVVKSDREQAPLPDTAVDYTARIISGSLKVTF